MTHDSAGMPWRGAQTSFQPGRGLDAQLSFQRNGMHPSRCPQWWPVLGRVAGSRQQPLVLPPSGCPALQLKVLQRGNFSPGRSVFWQAGTGYRTPALKSQCGILAAASAGCGLLAVSPLGFNSSGTHNRAGASSAFPA